MFVFCYGSLMRGMSNNWIIAGARVAGRSLFVGQATVRGFALHAVGHGGFPAVTRDNNENSVVRGELWSVGDDTLATLGHLEGVDGGLYRREVTLATLPLRMQCLRHEAVIYVWGGRHGVAALTPVPSGDWRAEVAQRVNVATEAGYSKLASGWAG